MEYVKSPLNYTGGKFKLLPQLLELFPQNVDTFVDLFGGGGNVAVNCKANHIVYNDLLWQVTDMLRLFREVGSEEALRCIDILIELFSLSKENKKGYLELRKLYNEWHKDDAEPFILYTLICHAFNYQIRFNFNNEYNMPFGKGRSGFAPTLREKFIKFVNRLQEIDIQFSAEDFREVYLGNLGKDDFVYCDPPYLVSTATYNERGGWSKQDEADLIGMLDRLNKRGVRFALSNVLESKGRSNDLLKAWAEKYTIHYLTSDYSNCSYQKKDRISKNVEVLITNY